MTYILPVARRNSRFLVIFAALFFPGAGHAVEAYDDCIALIAQDGPRAVREAGEWARFGGGAPARHCYAIALNENGASSRAADELLAIVDEEPDLKEDASAAILVQAGEILLELGDVLTARRVARQALRLSPGLVSALRITARSQIQTGDLQSAVDNLDRALSLRPGDPVLLVLRAAVHRQRGSLIAARDDAVFATEAAPREPSAWLERGRIAERMQDRDLARQAYLRAVDLDREGPTGRAARIALQRMETGALN
ncbi:MAG: tetratricopeptide repeat protein [Pseudomonadota bacterium]